MRKEKRFSWALNFTKKRFKKLKLAVPKNLKMFIQMLQKSRSSLQGGIKCAKQRRGIIDSKGCSAAKPSYRNSIWSIFCQIYVQGESYSTYFACLYACNQSVRSLYRCEFRLHKRFFFGHAVFFWTPCIFSDMLYCQKKKICKIL